MGFATRDPNQDWLGNSVWKVPDLKVHAVRSSASITAVTCDRGAGESTWRGERHRLVLAPDPLAWVDVQVEDGRVRHARQIEGGSLTFYPAGLSMRVVHPAARLVQVLWDTATYSTLLPEFAASVSSFEYIGGMQDALLGPIAAGLAEEIDGGVGDRILMESLGTALCIRIARRFAGRVPLPATSGLSRDRLQRVRDYIETHLGGELSLTTLAGIACLSPYHFSRSFKQATGIGPQRYVIERRLARAKALLHQTDQPIALIAQAAGFADQSHLTTMFRREIGATPGRFRAAQG